MSMVSRLCMYMYYLITKFVLQNSWLESAQYLILSSSPSRTSKWMQFNCIMLHTLYSLAWQFNWNLWTVYMINLDVILHHIIYQSKTQMRWFHLVAVDFNYPSVQLSTSNFLAYFNSPWYFGPWYIWKLGRCLKTENVRTKLENVGLRCGAGKDSSFTAWAQVLVINVLDSYLNIFCTH